MKVLFDHQIFASQVYGGISRYFFEIASHLSKMHKIDVEVLCPLYVNNYLENAVNFRVWGKHVRKFRNSALAMRLINAPLSLTFRRARRDTSIYHETYFSRFDLAPKGARKVVTVHDMIHEKFCDDFSQLDRTRAAKRSAVLRADHVICVSKNTKRDLLDRFDLDPAKVSVVYHGSSLRHDAFAVPRCRKAQLLYVGSRSKYKNFTRFIKAFRDSRLPHEGFSVVCFGGGQFSRSENALFESNGLSAYIHQIHGGDSVLLQMLQESTALVCPSIYEGFGIPPLEAMSCGCPVACSNTSSLPEVVGSAAELFDPRDIRSISTAIETIAFSSSRCAELVDAGYRQASRFSWDRSAEVTASIYRMVGG